MQKIIFLLALFSFVACNKTGTKAHTTTVAVADTVVVIFCDKTGVLFFQDKPIKMADFEKTMTLYLQALQKGGAKTLPKLVFSGEPLMMGTRGELRSEYEEVVAKLSK
jgi:hypothetical protein